MRQEAVPLQLWLACEDFRRHRRAAEVAERAPRIAASSVRRLLGRAMIAAGERLAGDSRDRGELRGAHHRRGRLVARPS